jgi:hypothetical protein
MLADISIGTTCFHTKQTFVCITKPAIGVGFAAPKLAMPKQAASKIAQPSPYCPKGLAKPKKIPIFV